MANYNAFTRTNYFRVTDEARLREIIESCSCGEDELQLFERTDNEGGKWFGFGAFDAISGLVLPEDDAIIITEVGYEKLRYVVGISIVITKTETKAIDLRNASIDAAKELLHNPKFYTVTEY